MLTAKNLQCMRAILSVAHCHGNLLGSSWHIILTVGLKIPYITSFEYLVFIFTNFLFLQFQTLQHLVWILGLKPMTSGLTSSGTSSTENSSVITTAVMADLPVLSNMVTRLFESSTELSDISVKYLIEALSRLSDESIELASSNREPSLFAVAKLLETALVSFFFSSNQNIKSNYVPIFLLNFFFTLTGKSWTCGCGLETNYKSFVSCLSTSSFENETMGMRSCYTFDKVFN